MAEAKPADPTRASDGNPRVVPLGTARPQAGRGHRARDGVSWGAFGIAVALLVFVTVGLLVQTQRATSQAARIGVLNSQVSGLEADLAAAHAQLAGYDRQLALIRAGVSSLVDQAATLNALVQANPVSPVPLAAPAASAQTPAAD
jgi:hypothetical protein